jgi:hypothetical protein
MREVLFPVDPVPVDTPLGRINVRPLSAGTVQVDAPYLTVDDVPLKASAFLNGSPKTRQFDLVKEIRDELGFTAPHALRATLVDGRTADVVVLGKIAEVVIPAVNKLAQERWALFLEAERRALNNSILGLEQGLETVRGRIDAKELELKAVEQELHKLLG